MYTVGGPGTIYRYNGDKWKDSIWANRRLINNAVDIVREKNITALTKKMFNHGERNIPEIHVNTSRNYSV